MYRSYKEFNGYSTAFRQHKADSHCRFIHGYNLEAKFHFVSDKLDLNNWVVDFGSLKELKKQLQDHFDHKTIISKKDPHVEKFKELHYLEIIDLVFMEDISIEMFARFCLNKANENLNDNTTCCKVEVFEHGGNSGIYEIES